MKRCCKNLCKIPKKRLAMESIAGENLLGLGLNRWRRIQNAVKHLRQSFLSKKVRDNESQYIALFVVSESIEKLFCEYLSLLNMFLNRFCPMKKCGVNPHCLYYDSLMLHRRYSTGNQISFLFSFAKEITALDCRIFCII